MNPNIKEELKKIIEEDPETQQDFESWTTRSIRGLALAVLELSNDVCSVKKQLKLVLWFLGSIIVLIIAGLFK